MSYVYVVLRSARGFAGRAAARFAGFRAVVVAGLPRAGVYGITERKVRFGELAGPLVAGPTWFDWQLVAAQAAVEAFGFPFEEILADDGIPFAPVAVETSVDRYPGVGDSVAVHVVPIDVGETSVELLYEIEDGGGEVLATARMTHVTITADGDALALPETVRSNVRDALVDRSPSVGPDDDGERADDRAALASFASSMRVRRPHVEGADLAYFEEYPRLADIALEEHLDRRGTPLSQLRGPTEPFRLRDWRWSFRSPVPYESTLRASCDVLTADAETVRVAHTFTSDGEVSIEGITEYGCFDRSGEPVAFDQAALAALGE